MLLTPNFKPSSGGVGEYLHSLWNEVAKKHSAIVYSSSPTGGASWPASYKFEYVQLPPDRALGIRPGDSFFLTRKLNSALYFRSLTRWARRFVARVAQTHGPDAELYVGWWDTDVHYWCKALQEAGVRYRLFVYGLDITKPYYGRFPELRRQDYCRAIALFGCSQQSSQLAVERLGYTGRTYAVTPGVTALDVPDDLDDRVAALRSSLGITDELILVTLGRVIKRKGFDVVIRSVAALKDRFPRLRYVAAGVEDTPEGAGFKALAQELGIADRVTFLGPVDNPTRVALYKLGDIFIMPNRELGGIDYEGFGIVFLEAGLMGKPVIGGNNGGVPDAIEHGVSGLLVDPEDPASTPAAIAQLLEDPELRARMGAAGHDRALRDFSWERIGEQFLEYSAEVR